MPQSAPTIRTDDNGLTLVLDRTIAAPRSIVWRCWTEEALFKQWYCPAPWTVPFADFNLKPGGRMNMLMQGPNGEQQDLKGCLLEIVPEERLTFTDAYTEGYKPSPSSFMTGFVELTDSGKTRTQMTWGARHATLEAAKQHLEMGFEDGWTASSTQLDTLAQTLAKQQS
ncbi:MAG: SRPBCC family protein [Alphaproteobacteria bacterium]|nr:polyketide cyclase [Rhodobiaceae bacterium]MBO6542222.1 SRPBCC family protein [Alphaproteobacteria bacterium]MBO6629075.1 SRPBCC family protein [Alphaproteobacteria bacterium]MDF1624922.1 SRPBCC family protein [Parvibaculaceae bacterium]